ncbi:thioredoxin family protein [Bacillus salitolerans]|uniref:Thioredoxin family protein n=1 Tax=Bacillus salitolerans TaxID=1437434 RepID=A0ABW4LV16_9BACI
MKKVIIFLVIIIGLFAALAFLTSYQNQQAAKGNPFGKAELNPATIKQLDDPNYQNIILPSELEDIIDSKGDATIYFYSPTCPHCVQTSPVIVPMADELGVDLQLFNLLEFEDGWRAYNIHSTPTVIRYEDGKEVARVEGQVADDEFRTWFEKWGK